MNKKSIDWATQMLFWPYIVHPNIIKFFRFRQKNFGKEFHYESLHSWEQMG